MRVSSPSRSALDYTVTLYQCHVIDYWMGNICSDKNQKKKQGNNQTRKKVILQYKSKWTLHSRISRTSILKYTDSILKPEPKKHHGLYRTGTEWNNEHTAVFSSICLPVNTHARTHTHTQNEVLNPRTHNREHYHSVLSSLCQWHRELAGMWGQGIKYVTSQPFSALLCEERTKWLRPEELILEAKKCFFSIKNMNPTNNTD